MILECTKQFLLLVCRLLKYLWQNREEENELMKDVPGWVTGTYYGQKIWNNPADMWMPLEYEDIYAHTHRNDCTTRHFFALMKY